MTEQNIDDITSVDPNDMLFRIYSSQVAKGLTRRQRQSVFAQWKVVQHAFEEYAERLSARQRDSWRRFFIQPLTSRRETVASSRLGLERRGTAGESQAEN